MLVRYANPTPGFQQGAAMRFRGKVALVTGAAQGIGREYARGFGAEGAAVALVDLNGAGLKETERMLGESGARAVSFEVDVTDESAVARMASAAADRLGRIDFLINNAGLHLEDYNETTRLDVSRWRRILDVNVVGPMLCAKHCRAALAASGAGAIVNQSSMAAYLAGGAYAISKLALNGLTVSLARELAPDRIRVNGIAPGLVASDAAMAGLEPALKQRVLSGQLVQRLGRIEDVVSMVQYLCSEEASFINGQTFLVDGGSVLHPA
jgi:NAD(P)-dependent dehydrogenase (short-subunit alcohol dehydrogenase family)